jgi:hypothetical protein
MQVIMQIEIYWIQPWFVAGRIFSMPWAPCMVREASAALFTGRSQAPISERYEYVFFSNK